MLAEPMEESRESDGRSGLGEAAGQVSAVREGGAVGRPGRQLGGSALWVCVVGVVVVVVIVGISSKGFTSGWRPRLRTCPSLSRAVAWNIVNIMMSYALSQPSMEELQSLARDCSAIVNKLLLFDS